MDRRFHWLRRPGRVRSLSSPTDAEVDGTAGRAAHVTVSGTALIRAATGVPMPGITDVGLDGTAGRAARAMFSVMDPIRVAILAPITDRLGPAAECSLNKRKRQALFDHFVRAGEKGCRHFETELLRSLEVDHQFVPGWCLDRRGGRRRGTRDAGLHRGPRRQGSGHESLGPLLLRWRRRSRSATRRLSRDRRRYRAPAPIRGRRLRTSRRARLWAGPALIRFHLGLANVCVRATRPCATRRERSERRG